MFLPAEFITSYTAFYESTFRPEGAKGDKKMFLKYSASKIGDVTCVLVSATKMFFNF